jgi:crotonobetainyl-CoA:carnitine CoA-transferase CaiB-like acyl-CoA transferase
MGSPAWTAEPRFSDNASRYDNHDALDELIGQWTSQRDRREIMHLLQKAGVAAGAVLTYADVLDDPQMQQRGFFQTLTRAVTGTHPYPGFPAEFSETPVSIRRPAPTLGQDNEHVLGTLLGMTTEEIARLEEAEIIGTQPQGWAFSMDADEAISRIKAIHQGDDSDASGE